MKLTNASKRFNRTPFVDAYDEDTGFRGRIMPFDDATRDSLSTERRILTVSPSVEIPPRNAIKHGDQVWLVGDRAIDTHGEDTLRHKYILHQAVELVGVYTFIGALTDTPFVEMWGNRLWVKGTKETDESSGVYDSYMMYFGKNEDIRDTTTDFFDGREQNVMIQMHGKWHLVRTTYLSAGGFLAAVVDELPEPVLLDVTHITRTHEPISDEYTTVQTVVKAVYLRWQSHFQYLSRYSSKFLEGDCVVKLDRGAVTVKAGDLIQVRNREYKVIEAQDETTVWHCHIRYV